MAAAKPAMHIPAKPHVALVRCRVQFIGRAAPSDSPDAIVAMQKPLCELFLNYCPQEAVLTVYTSGLSLQSVVDAATDRWLPMQDLNECAAMRPMGDQFVPLSSDDARKMPGCAVFAFMFRRHDIPVCDCWAVVTKSDDAAMALFGATKLAHKSRAGWATHGDRPPAVINKNKQESAGSLTMPEDWDGAIVKEQLMWGNKDVAAHSDFYEQPPLKGYFYAPRPDLIKQYSILGNQSCAALEVSPAVVPCDATCNATQPTVLPAQPAVTVVAAAAALPAPAAPTFPQPPALTTISQVLPPPQPAPVNYCVDFSGYGFEVDPATVGYYASEYPAAGGGLMLDQPMAFIVPENAPQVGVGRDQDWSRPQPFREYIVEEDCGCKLRDHKKKNKKDKNRNKNKSRGESHEVVEHVVPQSAVMVRQPVTELDDQPFEQYLPAPLPQQLYADHHQQQQLYGVYNGPAADYIRPLSDRRYESHISPGVAPPSGVLTDPYSDDGPYERRLPSSQWPAAADNTTIINRNFILRPRHRDLASASN